MQVLLAVFQALIDNGATVIVIEHDLNVIRSADYIIDMGPGGGESGGRVIASGTPEGTRYIMEQTPSSWRLAVVHRTTALNCSSPLRKNKEQVIPTGTTCSWYSGANQIRTIFLFSQGGFYVIECDGFCAILVVEGDNQLIIV